jgi:hypothetical protein
LETLTANNGVRIPDKVISEIRLLAEIAKAHGSLLSLQDVATLTHINLSEDQIAVHWHSIPALAETYDLKSGFMIERKPGNGSRPPITSEVVLEKLARGARYTSFAREFASLCRGEEINLVAISGSTSFQAVSETDDLDFFCITKPDTLWIFLTKSLLVSRLFRLFRRDAPRICFSYAVDQGFAEREFASSNDALFARDALTTIVIHGARSYKRLLMKSSWISNYFPQLYQRRTVTADGEQLEEPSVHSPARNFLNRLLSFIVGNYIVTKSSMLNRKFRRQGRISSLFRVRIGPDHCIFESIRYSNLRTMYNKFDVKPPETYTRSLSGQGAP